MNLTNRETVAPYNNPLRGDWKTFMEKDDRKSIAIKRDRVDPGVYNARVIRTMWIRIRNKNQEDVRVVFRLNDGREVYKYLYNTAPAMGYTTRALGKIGITNCEQIGKNIPCIIIAQIIVDNDKYNTGMETTVTDFKIIDVANESQTMQDSDKVPFSEQSEQTPSTLARAAGWSEHDLDEFEKIIQNP